MYNTLRDFLESKISLPQLKATCGENLYRVEIGSPLIVSSKDVILLIKKYLADQKSLQDVVDWVNVVWFTDLFEYNPTEEDSIASVMPYLESLDEEGVHFSNEEFLTMIYCLSHNIEYERN